MINTHSKTPVHNKGLPHKTELTKNTCVRKKVPVEKKMMRKILLCAILISANLILSKYCRGDAILILSKYRR